MERLSESGGAGTDTRRASRGRTGDGYHPNSTDVPLAKESPMEAVDQVLKAMQAAGEPVAAGKVAEMTGLDRKVVDKAMDELKKSGVIESPVRCKWQPKG